MAGQDIAEKARHGWRPVEAASQCAIGDNSPMTTPLAHDPLVIAANRTSRLLTGTGKFKDLDQTRLATEAAGAADRHRGHPPHQHRPEPGRAQPARRAAAGPLHHPAQHRRLLHRRRRGAHLRLARELLDGHNLVKLEVLGDQRRCIPTCRETLKAAETWSRTASR
jgi:thiazole synthase